MARFVVNLRIVDGPEGEPPRAVVTRTPTELQCKLAQIFDAPGPRQSDAEILRSLGISPDPPEATR